MNLYGKAAYFACFAHYGQKDKAGLAYIHHPVKVADMVKEHGEIVQAVALLHDVVEDTEVTLQEIEWHFGKEIAEAVLSVTRLSPEYEHRLGFAVKEKETYKDFVMRSAKNPIGKLVKIADIQHNSSPERMAALPEKDRGIIKRYEKALAYLIDGKEY